jgi:hypothetical protein
MPYLYRVPVCFYHKCGGISRLFRGTSRRNA